MTNKFLSSDLKIHFREIPVQYLQDAADLIMWHLAALEDVVVGEEYMLPSKDGVFVIRKIEEAGVEVVRLEFNAMNSPVEPADSEASESLIGFNTLHRQSTS